MARPKTNLQAAVEKLGKVQGGPEVPQAATPAFNSTDKTDRTGVKDLPDDVDAWLKKCRPPNVADQKTPNYYTARLAPDKVDVYEVPPTWVGPDDAPVWIGAPFLRFDSAAQRSEDAMDVHLKVYLGDEGDTREKKLAGAIDLPLIKISEDPECKCGIFVRGDVYGGAK